MKYLFAFLFACLLPFFNLSAQVSDLNPTWVTYSNILSPKSSSLVESGAAATDSAGNIYIAAFPTNMDSLGLDSLSIPCRANGAVGLVAKYDPNGRALWATTIGGQLDLNFQMISDKSGNLYLSNSFNNVAALLKLNSNGNLEWIDTAQGLAGLNWISFDPSGNIIACVVSHDSSPVFGTDTVTYPYRNTHPVMVSYTPTGQVNEAWNTVATIGSLSRGFMRDVIMTTGKDSSILLGGLFFDTVKVGSTIFYSPDTAYTEGLLVKYDLHGNVRWAKTVTGFGKAIAFSYLCSDEEGNFYIAGGMIDSMKLIDQVLYSPAVIGTKNSFVAKIDTGGNVIWAKVIKGQNNVVYDMSCSGNDLIELSGHLNDNDSLNWDGNLFQDIGACGDNSFVFAIDPVDGQLICGHTFPKGGDDFNAVAADAAGNLIYYGDYEIGLCQPDTAFIIGSDTVPAIGQQENLFLAKFNPCSNKGPNSLQGLPNSFKLLGLYPNPASAYTTASYIWPDGAMNASICVTDMEGKEIESYVLQKSQNAIPIDTRRLSSGLYVVSLIGDGRLNAVQKMAVE